MPSTSVDQREAALALMISGKSVSRSSCGNLLRAEVLGGETCLRWRSGDRALVVSPESSLPSAYGNVIKLTFDREVT